MDGNFLGSLVSELPLVAAFIFFSLRIITMYQVAQKEQADRFTQSQKEAGERSARMVETIVQTWASASDKRDENMKQFLTEIRAQEGTMLSGVAEDIKAFAQAAKEQTASIDHLRSTVERIDLRAKAEKAATEPRRSRKDTIVE